MIQGFFEGVFSYGKALGLIVKLRLWKYLFLPALIGLTVLGGIGFGAIGLADNIGTWLFNYYPFEWGSAIISTASNVVSGVLLFVIGLIISKHLILVAVSPFMSALSQKVEEELIGYRQPSGNMLKGFYRGLRIAIRNIIRELFFVAILLAFTFIPVVGIGFSVLIFLIQAYYAGFGNMDYTLERYFSVKDSTKFVKKNRGLALGNGTIFLLLLMTGIGILFAPPLATIAATIESTKRLAKVNNQHSNQSEFV